MSSSINTSSAVNPPAGPDQYRTMGVISVVATVVNLFILGVFCSSHHLLKSSSLLIGLTISHAINGLTHAISGFWFPYYSGIMVNPLFCIEVTWPSVYITTYQVLPLLLALAGLERLLALAAPLWYRTNCTQRRLVIVTIIAFSWGLVSMGINWLLAWYNSDHLVTGWCVPPVIVGEKYAIYGVHLPAILGGVSAFVCTTISVSVGRRRIEKMPSNSQNEVARIKKQIRLAKCLLFISIVDVICVVIPNVILVLYNTGYVYFPLRYTVYVVMLYCVDSVVNIVAFVLFNREFRKVSINVLLCRKVGSVAPSSFDPAALEHRNYDHHQHHHGDTMLHRHHQPEHQTENEHHERNHRGPKAHGHH